MLLLHCFCNYHSIFHIFPLLLLILVLFWDYHTILYGIIIFFCINGAFLWEVSYLVLPQYWFVLLLCCTLYLLKILCSIITVLFRYYHRIMLE